MVVGRRPHGSRPGARHHRRPLPRRQLPAAAVHVVQLHAHRLRDARRRTALGDGGGVDPRQRRPGRRDPRRARAARRDRRLRVRARGRPRHGGDRPDVPRRLGRRAARGRASRPATRPTASCISAPEPLPAGPGRSAVPAGVLDRSAYDPAGGADREVRMRKLVVSVLGRDDRGRALAACGGAAARRRTPPSTTDDGAASPSTDSDLSQLVADANKQKFKITYTDAAAATRRPTSRTATATACSAAATRRPSSRKTDTITCDKSSGTYECTQSPGSPAQLGQPVPRRRDARTSRSSTALGRPFGTHVDEDDRRPRRAVRDLLGEGPRRRRRRRDRRGRRPLKGSATRTASTKRPASTLRGLDHRRLRQARRRCSLVTKFESPTRRPTSRRPQRRPPPPSPRCRGVARRSRPAPARRIRRGSVADFPEAQAARRGQLPGRVAVAGSQHRHHLARPALARCRPPRACRRSRAPSASRTRWRRSRSGARRRLRRPSATRARAASATSPPGPCGRTRRSRARRRTGRPRAAARARSSGSATHHTKRSRNGSGTGRLRIV